MLFPDSERAGGHVSGLRDRGDKGEYFSLHEGKLSLSCRTSCHSCHMKDNHAEVGGLEVRENRDIQVTFASKDIADKFVGLSYVKCRGQTIERTKVVEKTPPKKEDRKRKHTDTKETSACLKLKGFKNSQTNFKTVQDALDRKGIKKFDIQFIQYNLEQKEAVVTLRNESVAGMALQAGLDI